jgi:hypothetical protein
VARAEAFQRLTETDRVGGQSDQAGEGAGHALPSRYRQDDRDGRSDRGAPSRGQAHPCRGATFRRQKNFSRPPYLFAQRGAYSRGRPNGQEDNDRLAAQPLANRRTDHRRFVPSITQME